VILFIQVLEATENAVTGQRVPGDVQVIIQKEATANDGTGNFLEDVTGRRKETCTFSCKA